ncbi:hypothetical protein Deima_2568 [Deinococcus maricopensis DSM 21211]|uniref:Uncharacterized protein n=1 Tax=Deinococcus maricopensis (strain DSM 21211 / LMG 22137 / NRRL B-23946 / LB-34) TaxID=709986 RepID=E8UAW3_DEIML|nr:hypothetical protein Deima_2568 [Deinococcus maricopensis DSM 21211]
MARMLAGWLALFRSPRHVRPVRPPSRPIDALDLLRALGCDE